MPVVPVGGSRSVATATGETPYPAARRDASPHHTTAPVVVATVDNLQRAVEEVKRTVRKAKREIIEDAHTARASEADRRRAPTGERSNQIAAVPPLRSIAMYFGFSRFAGYTFITAFADACCATVRFVTHAVE